MTIPRIAIIIGTTRQGRFSEQPAHWIARLAEQRDDLQAELIDLRDWPLPFFDEPKPIAQTPPQLELARRWEAKLAEFDGYIFVTAEYNHGIPAVLKNAIDYAYAEFNRKPAACVSYGGVSGARAVEQLRLVLIELQAAPLRNAVHIPGSQQQQIASGAATFEDFEFLAKSAESMFDQLHWWSTTLSAGRSRD
ncbi:MAG: NADPH-dependent FMN reductase [Microbacteriaceae bacterium]